MAYWVVFFIQIHLLLDIPRRQVIRDRPRSTPVHILSKPHIVIPVNLRLILRAAREGVMTKKSAVVSHQPRLLDQARDVIRFKHYSIRADS